MKIFLLMNLFLCGFFMTACGQDKSALPKEMPKDLEIRFNANYGMSPAYKKVFITTGEISLETRDYASNKQNFEINKWTAKIESEDISKLYQIFVENKFDTVKNDKRNGIVYDAPSEGISISLNDKDSFQVSYGDNSPMSGGNLKRYQAVKQAILDLTAKYQDKKQDKLSTENQQIFKYEDVSYLSELKNTKPAVLTKDELAVIEEILPKAVAEYNAKQTQDYRRIQEFSKYKRQIVPYLNEKGEKEIWINCLCSDDHENWKEQIIMVKDGGNCYFNFRLNLTSKKAFEFMVNGYA